MAESDCDIEYLDEDADIVQQCVQTVPALQVTGSLLVPQAVDKITPLLVERQPAERKRKRKKDEDDSDYDPNDDVVPPSPPTSLKQKKKKQNVVKKIKAYQKDVSQFPAHQSVPIPNLKGPVKKPKYFPVKEPVLDRKHYKIRIPDYEDPLCLPVKAIKSEESDVKRLNNWNNVCLEHFRHCDNMLKPERGDAHSSTRTVVFRNVINKQSGKLETTIWSKTSVENEDGDKKSEIFQCVLPRYKEKTALRTFSIGLRKPKPYQVRDEVILSKEDGRDGENLVVYKPNEHSSAVYKLFKATESKALLKEDGDDKEEEEESNMVMKEQTYVKICAPCYHTSWRGVRNNSNKSIACPVCNRSSVSVYNLLTHFKTHSNEDIRKYKKIISSILAEIVDYHYKCRICQDQFISIKKLRQHLSTAHQGTEVFTCEIGSHLAR